MSYCRFGDDSDVYLIKHVEGGWECCSCLLERDNGVWFKHLSTLDEVLDHLNLHKAHNHKVPIYAFNRVRKEIIGK